MSDAISAGRPMRSRDFVVAYYLTCELIFTANIAGLQGEPTRNGPPGGRTRGNKRAYDKGRRSNAGSRAGRTGQ